MDRRSFFKFLGFGAAAAPVVAKDLAAVPVPPLPVLPPATSICPPAFYVPQGFSGTFSITLRMPSSAVPHNWGAPPIEMQGYGWPRSKQAALEDFDEQWSRLHGACMLEGPAVRDREFYRLRHARKHGGF